MGEHFPTFFYQDDEKFEGAIDGFERSAIPVLVMMYGLAQAMIMSGVKVGDGAIIASRGGCDQRCSAIHSVVGSNPARHIRYRFNETEINSIARNEMVGVGEENGSKAQCR
ncbi:hypothetical protein O9992_18590 [Vibrio lentus]|nr:hypothetical protein [Vibrio lentus]